MLDGARCQNTAITIRKIKLKAEAVAEGLLKCDVNTLSKEKLELINLIMPNKEEEDGLREYVDSGKKVNDLSDVEQYIYELLKLARVHDKLLLCTLRASGHIKLHELESSLKQIQAGCRALTECTALKDILDVVVQVGNVLNCTAPSRLVEAGKGGIRLKTLEKLAVTKAVRGEHPDLLHFVVMLIMEHKPHSVEINPQQIKAIEDASRVDAASLKAEIATLKGQAKVAETELKHPDTVDHQSSAVRVFGTHLKEKVEKLEARSRQCDEHKLKTLAAFAENPAASDVSELFMLVKAFAVQWSKTVQKLQQKKEEADKQARMAAAALDRARSSTDGTGDSRLSRERAGTGGATRSGRRKTKITPARKKSMHAALARTQAGIDGLLGTMSGGAMDLEKIRAAVGGSDSDNSDDANGAWDASDSSDDESD